MNAREALPITAAGGSFTVCIPAAFVTFSTLGTNNLRREARARVIAAGPFHNFVSWCLLALLLRLGIANLSIMISGYTNVSAIGKVIVDVKAVGPH
jgi:S2P endopeptidase